MGVRDKWGKFHINQLALNPSPGVPPGIGSSCSVTPPQEQGPWADLGTGALGRGIQTLDITKNHREKEIQKLENIRNPRK